MKSVFSQSAAENAVAAATGLPVAPTHGAATKALHCGLVGEAPVMRKLYQSIERVAATGASVFLTGESGVGKEMVARAIHDTSGRTGPFVACNCGAFSASLLGSELFGHERGAFTGAVERRTGIFEKAQDGTLFLDEITEMPLEQQKSLLRVLENRTLVRLGGTTTIPVNCRIITATNCSEQQLVEQHRLREDLFYRIAALPLHVPPLRERMQDLPLLVHSFLEVLNREHGTSLRVSAAQIGVLSAYSWPGNVRELRHAILRAYVLADPGSMYIQIPDDLASPFIRYSGNSQRCLPGSTLEEAEKQLIRDTLIRCANNKTQAAAALGVSVKTLYNRLASWNL